MGSVSGDVTCVWTQCRQLTLCVCFIILANLHVQQLLLKLLYDECLLSGEARRGLGSMLLLFKAFFQALDLFLVLSDFSVFGVLIDLWVVFYQLDLW